MSYYGQALAADGPADADGPSSVVNASVPMPQVLYNPRTDAPRRGSLMSAGAGLWSTPAPDKWLKRQVCRRARSLGLVFFGLDVPFLMA